MDIRYEWDCEELDGDGDDADIIDHHHGDTLVEVMDWIKHCAHYRIVLVRDRGDDIEGLVDRQWAYVTNGRLPDRFDWGGGETGGAKVPQRFHREVANVRPS